jgi:phospholipid/cholesterol/gamma-HCH transport system substrate-binding protein
MTQHERGLEFKVGAFVFVGMTMLAALVVQFGRIGEGFKTYYPVTVRFADASGLLKGSDVLLAGAKIGRVSDGPHLVREGNGVAVPLRIYDYVKIPVGSKFSVGSSGLLGDRFVSVNMPPGKPKEFLPKGAEIDGTRETGLDDLTKQGGELIGDLRATVQNINTTVSRLNQEALSPGNMENLKGSFAHLNETTTSLAETSKKLDGAIDQANAAMGSIRKDADDMHLVVADARKTVQAATQVFRDATEGKGLLAALLTNQDLANDLRALIANLRAHGVLFYRDSGAKIEMNTREQNKQRRPAGGRP